METCVIFSIPMARDFSMVSGGWSLVWGSTTALGGFIASFYVVLVLSQDSGIATDVYIMYLSVTYDFSHTATYLRCALFFMVI